jgi:hypothetical protein
MTILTAIQCTDKRTLQKGTFGYFERRPLYSVTPVFESLVDLNAYCAKHNIQREGQETTPFNS